MSGNCPPYTDADSLTILYTVYAYSADEASGAMEQMEQVEQMEQSEQIHWTATSSGGNLLWWCQVMLPINLFRRVFFLTLYDVVEILFVT